MSLLSVRDLSAELWRSGAAAGGRRDRARGRVLPVRGDDGGGGGGGGGGATAVAASRAIQDTTARGRHRGRRSSGPQGGLGVPGAGSPSRRVAYHRAQRGHQRAVRAVVPATT